MITWFDSLELALKIRGFLSSQNTVQRAVCRYEQMRQIDVKEAVVHVIYLGVQVYCIFHIFPGGYEV